MTISAIIAEFNPLHNGHEYIIQKAREITNADYVIVIMSGSFTEQGNISVTSKFSRAKCAISCGADLVIELPTIYATSSSENFAHGAINILNSLNIVDYLVFGSEESNINLLEKVAEIYLNNENEIISKSKKYIKEGLSSVKAFSKVFDEYINGIPIDISLPNNLLAIEYIKALKRLKSNITPVSVKRSSSHNNLEAPLNSKYASSTAIRELLWDNCKVYENFEKIKKFVPQITYEELQNNRINSNETIWPNLKYEIIKLGIEGLKDIYEVNEGIEKRIYKYALSASNYEEFIFLVKTKRYTLSRIKRICIYILLGISKNKKEEMFNAKYARIIKVNKNGKKILSLISKNSSIPVISKITETSMSNLLEKDKASLKIDIMANNILYSNEKINDYTNTIIL